MAVSSELPHGAVPHSKALLWTIRILAITYAIAVLIASLRHSPQLWGIHSIGFLPSLWSLPLGALLIAGVVLLFRHSGPAFVNGAHPPDRTSPRLVEKAPRTPPIGWAVPVALAASLAMWLLRCRTPFLGDGIRWLALVQHGGFPTPSEPFSAALWMGAVAALRSLSVPVDASTIGAFAVLCGLGAVIVYWLIAYEVARATQGAFWIAFGILGTLGLNQLFFGYIEAYPPAALFGLTYVWLGIRSTRERAGSGVSGVVLGLAIASHLLNSYLLPSYAALIWMERRPLVVRMGQLATPLAVAVLLTAVSGYDLASFTAALRLPGRHGEHFALLGPGGEPYAAISLAHATDVLNELLLVLPVPAILLGAGLISGVFRSPRDSATTIFLLAATAPGILAVSALMLPMPMVIDWDLHSLLLIPTAVLGVWTCRHHLSHPSWGGVRAGLLCIGLASSLPFIAVNADVTSGLYRFETVVGPGARITRYGANHGGEVLVHYLRDRGDLDAAFRHASQLVEREPQSGRYLALAGTILYLQRSYERATPYLQASVNLQPDSLGTRTNLAICYSKTGRHREALEEFQTVLSEDPDSPRQHLNYAIECAAIGLHDEARRTLIETLRRWPDYAPARQAYRRVVESAPSLPSSPRP